MGTGSQGDSPLNVNPLLPAAAAGHGNGIQYCIVAGLIEREAAATALACNTVGDSISTGSRYKYLGGGVGQPVVGVNIAGIHSAASIGGGFGLDAAHGREIFRLYGEWHGGADLFYLQPVKIEPTVNGRDAKIMDTCGEGDCALHGCPDLPTAGRGNCHCIVDGAFTRLIKGKTAAHGGKTVRFNG